MTIDWALCESDAGQYCYCPAHEEYRASIFAREDARLRALAVPWGRLTREVCACRRCPAHDLDDLDDSERAPGEFWHWIPCDVCGCFYIGAGVDEQVSGCAPVGPSEGPGY